MLLLIRTLTIIISITYNLTKINYIGDNIFGRVIKFQQLLTVTKGIITLFNFHLKIHNQNKK